ncbi:MAG: hypothetical protein H0V90_10280 [Blastocatellia bacterium]|jgi:hypothetical protein|nr:hypothetical protein [Blastocatellia bacterium]
MKKALENLLVVTPFSKRFGIAVFRHGELLYFAVNSYRQPRTLDSIQADAMMKLKNLFDKFTPGLIILKSLTRHQAASNNHRHVVMTIKSIAKMYSVPVEEISFKDARCKLLTGQVPTYNRTFATLRDTFPELTRFTLFQNRSQREYYMPLLSAVAIGLARVGTEPRPREIS